MDPELQALSLSGLEFLEQGADAKVKALHPPNISNPGLFPFHLGQISTKPEAKKILCLVPHQTCPPSAALISLYKVFKKKELQSFRKRNGTFLGREENISRCCLSQHTKAID